MTADLEAPRPARHRHRLRRSLQLLHGFILAGFAMVTLLAADPGGRATALWLHVALGAGQAALGAVIALRGERPEHVLATFPMVAMAAMPAFQAPGDISAGLALSACGLGAVRTLRTPSYVGTVVTAAVVYAVAQALTGPGPEVGHLVTTYSMAFVTTYVAGMFVATLEGSTTARDRAEAQTQARDLELAAREARDRAVDGARQVLHDDILTALRAVADGVDAESAVRQCRSAVAAMDQLGGDEADAAEAGPPGPHGPDADAWLPRLLAEVGRGSPVALELDVRLGARVAQVDLPEEQVAAVARAVQEALRNAHRHAGVDRVTLAVTSTARTVELVVSDRGPGIAVDAQPGIGLTESVHGAMQAVGGTAQVASTTAGTTVRVSLPTRPRHRVGSTLARTYALTVEAGGHQQLAWRTVGPLSANWVFLGGSEALRSDRVAPSLALLVVVTALCLEVARRLSARAPGPAWTLAVALALVVLQVVGLLMLEPGGMLDLRSWSVGYLAIVPLLLCFVLPVPWGLALIASQVVVVQLAAWIDPALSDGRIPVASLNAVIANPTLTLLLGAGLRRNARLVEREQAQGLAASVALLQRQSSAEVSSLHLDHTRRVVVPWLRAVAERRLDPHDGSTRERARLLALETRDDLHAPGFHSPDLRERVTRFRAAGGVVDIRPGFTPGAHDRATGRLLAGVLARLPAGTAARPHRVTLSPSATAAGAVRLVVLPPPDPGTVDDLLTRLGDDGGSPVRVQHDEFTLVCEFEDRAP